MVEPQQPKQHKLKAVDKLAMAELELEAQFKQPANMYKAT